MELHALSEHPDPQSGLTDRDALAYRMDGALTAMRSVGFGHWVGMLRVHGASGRGEEVARLLRFAVRPGDTVAVVADDGFVVLCDRLRDPDDLLAIAHRVELAFDAAPGSCDSIDVAVLDVSDRDPMALLVPDCPSELPNDPTDLPFGTWLRFGDALRGRATSREEAEVALRSTIDGRDLFLEYQPEMELRTGRIVAAEALVRWQRDGHVVGPDDFIPLAEHTGLIVPIGAWVLRTACEQLSRWQAGAGDGGAGAPRMSVAVNVSPAQLLHDDFVPLVADTFAATGMGSGDVVLELTEGVLLGDLDLARQRLEQLRALGARIAVDDFGTGYASLTYLHRLPVDIVKLDRSFVEGVGTDPRLTAIVTSVLGLLQALGLDSVAEGVATDENASRLADLGCRLAQGSWVGPPVAGSDLALRLG